MKQEHGGNIFEYDIAYDFSANLNPLGMPESVKKAAADAAAESEKYPDPYCRSLTRKIALHEGIGEENIVCGNGADDLKRLQSGQGRAQYSGKSGYTQYITV